MWRMCAAALMVVVLTAVAGCAGTDDATPARSPRAAASTASSSPSAPVALVSLHGALARCGPQYDRFRRTPMRTFTLRGPAGARLPAATLGKGRTVVVLLHQTDGAGLCGWLGFAARIAQRPGQAALVFDLCGYGDARCGQHKFGVDQDAQVALAVRHARRQMQATRVVLVGASMGGSLAVRGAAARVPVDSFVDLSGPIVWDDVMLAKRVRRAQVPGLFAMGRSDGDEAFSTTRAMAGAAPRGSRFVGTQDGHGYELVEDLDGALLPIGRDVLAWIAAPTH